MKSRVGSCLGRVLGQAQELLHAAARAVPSRVHSGQCRRSVEDHQAAHPRSARASPAPALPRRRGCDRRRRPGAGSPSASTTSSAERARAHADRAAHASRSPQRPEDPAPCSSSSGGTAREQRPPRCGCWRRGRESAPRAAAPGSTGRTPDAGRTTADRQGLALRRGVHGSTLCHGRERCRRCASRARLLASTRRRGVYLAVSGRRPAT